MSIFSDIKQAIQLKVQESIAKANSNIEYFKEENKRKNQLVNPKSLINSDNDENIDAGGYRDRNSPVSFEVLRSMAIKDSIIASVITTRVNQVKNFTQHQENKYSEGFKIKMRNSEEQPSKEDKKNIDELENWILNTGSDQDRPEKYKRDFTEFLALITKDLLTYDQIAIELVPSQDGSIAYLVPVSGGSIRYASKKTQITQNDILFLDDENKNRIDSDSRPYDYVQVYQGRIVRGFYREELIFKMMNPTTDIDSYGYSMGPLELLANVVMNHLNAEAHNKLFFIQGFASRGIIHIEGEIPAQQLEAFRKQWREQTSGVTNSWRTPIIAGGDRLNWVKLQENNRDMEWSNWVDYLIKIICAVYLISPQEINFDNTKNQSTSLGDSGKRSEVQVKESKYKGLKPILKFYESIINEYIIKSISEDLYRRYKFVFCGLDNESQSDELQRQTEEGKTFKTVNEIRAERDMEPIEGGDIILDTNYLKWLMQETDIDGQEKDLSPDKKEDITDTVDINDEDITINKVSKKVKKSFNDSSLLKIEYYQ